MLAIASDPQDTISQKLAEPKQNVPTSIGDSMVAIKTELRNTTSSTHSTPPVLPELSQATADILARVQSGRSTPNGVGPRRGSFQSDIPPGHRKPPPVVSHPAADTPSYLGELVASNEDASQLWNQARPAWKTGFEIAKSVDDASATSSHSAWNRARSAYHGSLGMNNSFNNSSATDSDPSLEKLQKAAAFGPTSMPPNSHLIGKSGLTDSTIHVAASEGPNTATPGPAQPRSNIWSESAARRQRAYTLADGTVVNSGKGLGRGRPGIKRGPRKPKIGPHASVASVTPAPTTTVTPTAAAVLVTTPVPSFEASKKRKRSTLSVGENRVKTPNSISDAEEEGFSSDSDHYTPQATQTRSGRHTQKPSTFVPTDSPVTKKPRLGNDESISQTKRPLIKRKAYRGKEQSALCEHCLRGHGPMSNAIVFCDGCNRCWHQRCHAPMIANELVQDSTAEWFCKECTEALRRSTTNTINKGLIQAGKTAIEIAPTPSSSNDRTPAPSQPFSQNLPVISSTMPAPVSLMGGRLLMPEQKRQYLNSLPREQLIDLLTHASILAPDLPLFPAPAHAQVPPLTHPPSLQPGAPSTAQNATAAPTPKPSVYVSQSASSFDTMKPPPLPANSGNQKPVAASRVLISTPFNRSTPLSEVSDLEDDEFYVDEHVRLYPKAGHGIAAMFPPEAADLHILLEGPDSKTFSHALRPGLVAA